MSGIPPVNLFRYRSKLTRFVKFPSSKGIIPLILLLYSSKYCRFFNCPSWDTNAPDSCAFPRSTLITLLSVLQVTWNHVHGLTRVGSQLCSTLLASLRLWRRLYRASPSVLAATRLTASTSDRTAAAAHQHLRSISGDAAIRAQAAARWARLKAAAYARCRSPAPF